MTEPSALRLVVSKSVVVADVGDEAVLLNPETGTYFGLNDLGRQIWTLLEQGLTSEDIFRHLLAEYDVEAAQLRTDLTSLLTSLQSHGLVHVAAV